MIILIEHHAKRNQPKYRFFNKRCFLFVHNFFCCIKVDRWKKKEKKKKEVKLRVHCLGKILKYEGPRLGRIRTEVEK